VVVDSSVLIAIHLKEPGWDVLLDKIAAAPEVIVGAPTLLETAIVLSARLRQDVQPLLMLLLRRLTIRLIPFSEEHYEAAIDAFLRFGKGRHPAGLNFGDCMAYAVAAVSGLPLLYTGGDFARTDIQSA
jgi:ribonuclease VapC